MLGGNETWYTDTDLPFHVKSIIITSPQVLQRQLKIHGGQSLMPYSTWYIMQSLNFKDVCVARCIHIIVTLYAENNHMSAEVILRYMTRYEKTWQKSPYYNVW